MNLLVHVPYCKHWSFDFKEIMRAEIYNIKRSYLFTQFYFIIHDRLTIEQTKRGNSLSLQNCRNLSLSLSFLVQLFRRVTFVKCETISLI